MFFMPLVFEKVTFCQCMRRISCMTIARARAHSMIGRGRDTT